MRISEAGLEIGRRRVALRLSQSELARRAGVYRDTVGNIETGKTQNPQDYVLNSLLRALTDAELERDLPPEATPVVAGDNVRLTLQLSSGRSIMVESSVEHIEVLDRLVDRILLNLKGDL